MRTGISITVSAADRKQLQAVFRGHNVAQKHAWLAMPTSERGDNFLRFGRPGKALGPAVVLVVPLEGGGNARLVQANRVPDGTGPVENWMPYGIAN
jgi:hypothetical protein